MNIEIFPFENFCQAGRKTCQACKNSVKLVRTLSSWSAFLSRYRRKERDENIGQEKRESQTTHAERRDSGKSIYIVDDGCICKLWQWLDLT